METENIISSNLINKKRLKCYDLSSDNNQQNNLETKKCQKMPQIIYYCNNCYFKCCKKSNYEKHILTKKHLQLNTESYAASSDEDINNTNQIYNYICNCGKKYKNRSGLWKHNNENKCIPKVNAPINEKIIINDDTISSIMSEIKILMVEQNKMNKMITEIANKPTNITNNNNNQTNNQQFNMNVFLNETCKDAMNMSEFIENLQVSMEDMEKTGELGFAKGMSRIIMNNLNAIDVCKRPIHCSDVKRETLYVKNNGVWEKETEDRKKTKEVIYRISSLNVKQLLKWRDLPRNKGYEKSDHKKNDEFTKLVMEINKLREEEIDKVITNISKHVAIDKNKVKMSGYLS